MKLHRLVLENYRGITYREIVLPDSGVIVVSGANEIGKSSMIEALDLLLEAKDRSTKKEVKQVKPTHTDVGAEVMAEISSGPYRFVYRKRFHKKCETELTVLAPRREQLTGDEAHERVCAILAETVDTDLWRAQRVLQAASTAPVDLSRCDALSRALDVAAGQPTTLSGDEPLLIDRIDAEYARYFTPTGRATGECAAAITRRAQAAAEVGRCAAAVAEVDDCVRRHAELSERLDALKAQREPAQQRLTAARAAAAIAAELAAQVKEADVMATAARATAEVSGAALAERRRLADEVARLGRAAADTEDEATRAAEDESVASDVNDVAAAAAEQSDTALQQAQDRADAARAAVERLHDRDKVLQDIEVAVAAVESASGQAALASAHIELTATAGIDLVVQGRPIRLSAGETFATSVTEATDVEVPGVLRARVVPGAPACNTQAALEAAESRLRDLLARAGVDDVAGARAQAGADTASARAALDAATGAHREAIAACQRDRDVAAAATSALAEKHTRAVVLREKLAATRTQLDAAQQRLAEQRTTISDDDLAVRARTDAAESERAAARAAELRSHLTEIVPERIEAELGDAQQQTDDLTRDHDKVAGEIRDVATQLRVYGTEGRKGRLDAAEAEYEHADSEWVRIGRRARAVQLLRAVVLRHRDDTRLRYVEPFRAEIHRLGRIVFGDSFEVEIDSSLRICSRTLDGRTVPYESLSGGAKEQLGIVARLAGAVLVAKQDGVPVIIDDALGFTDSDRLARMGAVFGAVGSDTQMLVLTCSPRRYDSVDGAHHIELTA